jgi:nicotinamide phosphoribosyltransferase
MPAFSIPAAEHSTITSWGGPDHEIEAFANMCEKFRDKGPLFAVVSDSYDIFRAVKEHWGKTLKGTVEALAETNQTLVVRPDSGDPTKVPVQVVEMLGEAFGYTVNKKGFKVLPKFVRCIQGDGVNQRSIRMILKNLVAARWSTENVAFGMGGALLQQVNRDTLQFAMKTCAITRNGVEVDVFKQPVTDPGKNSKRGDQATIQISPIDYISIKRSAMNDNQVDAMVPVWRGGTLLVDHTFAEVRSRAVEGFRYLFNRNGWKPESVRKAA